jgi:hypothetical protein
MDQTTVVATDNIITGGTIANVGAGAITIQSSQRNRSRRADHGHATSTASTAGDLLQHSAYASPAAEHRQHFSDIQVRDAATPANYTYGVKFDSRHGRRQRNRFESCFFGAPATATATGRDHQHRAASTRT